MVMQPKRRQQAAVRDWPSARWTGIFPLHCVNTVERWTHAVSTIAWVCAITSCSSWQRMQVSTSLSAGVEPLWGPMATHISICSMAQLEEGTPSRAVRGGQNLRFRGRGLFRLYLSEAVTVSPWVPLSGMLSYSILLDSMKFFCMADIWAIIFCRWSLAASAFLLRSAFSLSWAVWNGANLGEKK